MITVPKHGHWAIDEILLSG